jgi:hypothetical protein
MMGVSSAMIKPFLWVTSDGKRVKGARPSRHRFHSLLLLIAMFCFPRSAVAEQSSAQIHNEMSQQIQELRAAQIRLQNSEQEVYRTRQALVRAKAAGVSVEELVATQDRARQARTEIRRMRRDVRKTERAFDRSFRNLRGKARHASSTDQSVAPEASHDPGATQALMSLPACVAKLNNFLALELAETDKRAREAAKINTAELP